MTHKENEKSLGVCRNLRSLRNTKFSHFSILLYLTATPNVLEPNQAADSRQTKFSFLQSIPWRSGTAWVVVGSPDYRIITLYSLQDHCLANTQEVINLIINVIPDYSHRQRSLLWIFSLLSWAVPSIQCLRKWSSEMVD